MIILCYCRRFRLWSSLKASNNYSFYILTQYKIAAMNKECTGIFQNLELCHNVFVVELDFFILGRKAACRSSTWAGRTEWKTGRGRRSNTGTGIIISITFLHMRARAHTCIYMYCLLIVCYSIYVYNVPQLKWYHFRNQYGFNKFYPKFSKFYLKFLEPYPH